MEKTELDYRLELIKLVSYCSTCRKNNLEYWMLGLCKHLNDTMEFLMHQERLNLATTLPVTSTSSESLVLPTHYEYDGYGLILKEGEENKPINKEEEHYV